MLYWNQCCTAGVTEHEMKRARMVGLALQRGVELRERPPRVSVTIDPRQGHLDGKATRLLLASGLHSSQECQRESCGQGISWTRSSTTETSR